MTSLEFTKDSQALREKILELESVINNCEDGIVNFSAHGTVKSVNASFLRMTHLDAKELIGITEYQFNTALGRISKAEKTYSISPWHEEAIHYFDFGVLHLDDSNAKSQIVEDREREVLVVKRFEKTSDLTDGLSKIVFFRDITEQVKQSTSKSSFIAKAAHELRTPMTSIQGFSELLLQRELDQETVKELLTIIHSQSESLVALINQVMEISRIDSRVHQDSCFEEQPVWPIVEKAIGKGQSLYPDRRLIVHAPNIRHYVKADFDKLNRAIANVLDNAFRYSSADDEITIDIEDKRDASGNGLVGIVVRDVGVGMTGEEVSKIFDPFWRSANNKDARGMGLGMSLAKALTNLHQGTIDVRSEPGRGTEVSLWLPDVSASGLQAHG